MVLTQVELACLGLGVDIIKPLSRYLTFQLTDDIDEPIDLVTHLPYRIAVVSNLLALNRDWYIRDLCQLDPREMRVLLNIGSYMPIKAADIAYQSRMDSYTISRAVKKLLAAGLIISVKDTEKKNVKNLTLTAKGQDLYQQLSQAIDQRGKQLESVLSASELQSLFEMLERLEDKAESLLVEHANDFINQGKTAPADQKELIRWHKKSNSD